MLTLQSLFEHSAGNNHKYTQSIQQSTDTHRSIPEIYTQKSIGINAISKGFHRCNNPRPAVTMSRHILPTAFLVTSCILVTSGNKGLWVAWWEIPPFTYRKVNFDHDAYHAAHNDSQHVNGVLSNALHKMVDKCYPDEKLHFAEYQNEKELFQHIGPSSNITFAFPVIRSLLLKDMDSLLTNITYLPILETPGPLILSSAADHHGAALTSLLGTWPLLLVVLSTASIAGIIIWALDHYWNPEQFPKNFFEGFWEGIWWAFVTMTTVGYGDKTPTSVPARMFGFLWIIVGVVIMSIFTATLSTAFSAEHLDPNNIVGLTVGVMSGTEDYVAGFMFGAKIKEFPSIHELLEALVEDDEIHYVLVDTFNGFHSSVTFESKGVYVKGIVSRPSVHGVMVYGQPPEKIACMAEVISHTRYEIYENVENLLHVLESQVGAKSRQTSSNILGSTLIFSYVSVGIWALLFIAALLYEFLYHRPKARRNQAKTKVEETKITNISNGETSPQKHHDNNKNHSNSNGTNSNSVNGNLSTLNMVNMFSDKF